MSVTNRTLRVRAIAAVCALAGSAALVTACGAEEVTRAGAAAPTPTHATPSPRLTQDQAERKALVPAAKVGWDKAAATAVGEVPRGKLVEIELKRATAASPSPGSPSPGDTANPFNPSPATPSPASPSPGTGPTPGAPEWVAKVAGTDGTVRTLHIDAVTGKVTRSQVERGQDADDKRELTDRLGRAERTPQQAAKTATDKRKGTVTAVQLDEDDANRLIWSVDVVTTKDWYKTTYDVDAANGRVLREHVDRD
ncbi:PepSY domain-containing protein [Streptomyces sp. NPDC045431]|uniref:PepSY domain-containing protein n=1 Tax=Streptomyces sp. NPDC045431 TaxID=3155613 RepID=UPI0033D6E066